MIMAAPQSQSIYLMAAPCRGSNAPPFITSCVDVHLKTGAQRGAVLCRKSPAGTGNREAGRGQLALALLSPRPKVGRPLPISPRYPGRAEELHLRGKPMGWAHGVFQLRSCLRWLPLQLSGEWSKAVCPQPNGPRPLPACLHLVSTSLIHRDPVSSTSGHSHAIAFPASTPPPGSPPGLLQVSEPCYP